MKQNTTATTVLTFAAAVASAALLSVIYDVQTSDGFRSNVVVKIVESIVGCGPPPGMAVTLPEWKMIAFDGDDDGG